MGFLDDYEPVEDRIRRFYEDHGEGRITTSLLHFDERGYIVHAAVYRPGEDVPAATGLAQETIGSSNVNKTSALENCETSAIGRALANLNYAPKGARPSREEMSKSQPVVEGYACPSCGSDVINNIKAHGEDKKQPAFKCPNKDCQGGGAKKKGDGNWPWATWDADYYRNLENPEPTDGEPIREEYDPNDIARPF